MNSFFVKSRKQYNWELDYTKKVGNSTSNKRSAVITWRK